MRYTDVIEETRDYVAGTPDKGVRLDNFIVQHARDFSRSFIKKITEHGMVKINGNVSKPSKKIQIGDVIQFNIPQVMEMSAEPEDIPLQVLYEDKAIIVVNKQPGLVVHPSPGHETGTLVNALLYHCRDLSGIGGELRPGIVHRLDQDTSGCIVCAKTDKAHQHLVEQFSSRTTEKKYLALTNGVPRPVEGKVEGLIGRHPKHRQKMALVEASGRYSLTFYKVIENFQDKFCLVECDIKTGRTHQIRVHMRSVGAPVLCDSTYGREAHISSQQLTGTGKSPEPVLQRQALHARYLSIIHPETEEKLNFSAPLYTDMENALQLLRS